MANSFAYWMGNQLSGMKCSIEVAVPDYRCKRGQRYPAAQVLVILLLAKLAGEQALG
jgi:hypothetical protein